MTMLNKQTSIMRKAWLVLPLLLSLIVSGLYASSPLKAEAAAKQTLYNSPYVKFSPDGQAWTSNYNGSTSYTYYTYGETVSIGISSSIIVGTGQHKYTYFRDGEIPIAKWVMVDGERVCMQDGVNTVWHGVTLTARKCYTPHNPGWFPYCADCGDVIGVYSERNIGMLIYANKTQVESIDYLDADLDYWYNCPTCQGTEQGAGFTHQCQGVSYNRYYVRYNANGGSGSMANTTHYYNNATTYEGVAVSGATSLRNNSFTRTNYIFKGWNTRADGTGTTYTNGQAVKNLTAVNGATVDLYAQWELQTFKLTINPNGGTWGGSTGNQSFSQVPNSTKAIANPTRTDYDFTGWTLTGGGSLSGTTYKFGTSDATLKAGWIPSNWYINYHNTNGSTGTIAKQTIQRNTYANLSRGTELSLNHSVLLGWTSDSATKRKLTATAEYALGQQVYNLVSAGQTKDLYAVWRPWYYYVNYHNNIPGQPDVSTNRNNVKYEIDVEQTPMTWSEASAITGFQRDGYYIERWSSGPVLQGPGYRCVNPYTSVGASTFKNLALDTETAELYAIWKGNPYKIIIHDNYRGCSCDDEVHNVNVGEDFALTKITNKHGSNAMLLGYSLTSDYTATPQYKVGQTVRDLTTKAGAEIHLYRIWDDPPEVESPSLITFNREKAAAAGITFNSDGTIKQSDLVVYLMTFAHAKDYEYTKRYGTEVPAGVNNGYKFNIASIDPVAMQNNLEHTSDYIITYICVDEVGNFATSTTELFFGDEGISILFDTN